MVQCNDPNMPTGKQIGCQYRKFDRQSLEVSTSKRAEPRVPFGQLVERGMLQPGEKLYALNGRHTAKVRADGTLIGHDCKGSIHQVGAALEGAPSCNGWTYWGFRKEGKTMIGEREFDVGLRSFSFSTSRDFVYHTTHSLSER